LEVFFPISRGSHIPSSALTGIRVTQKYRKKINDFLVIVLAIIL